jgi:chromosomal replication initiation ATPase DnaA
VLINSYYSIKDIKFNLIDLKSRINSFLQIGIDLPTDDLLKVIISKTLSDKQININPKLSNFIINNVERSYEQVFSFLKKIDETSLSAKKSININLIKRVIDAQV